MSYLSKWFNKNKTPQSAPIPGTSQVSNSAGGFAFAVDEWTRLDRFLILGAEGGSYYASERKLTRENAQAVLRCLQLDGRRVVRIVAISDEGRAAKTDPALFALALAAKLGDVDTRRAAFAALPRVARIGTHLFHFAEYVKALGGWGRGTMRAFARWYTDMEAGRLALQAVKYQSRDGWSHRDLLRKAHPVAKDERQQAIFHWMTKGWEGVGETPHPDQVLAMIWAFERAKSLREKKDVALLCSLIHDYRLPHECVPTEMKRHAEVWEALLPEMGLAAMVRNLGKMTEVGLLGAVLGRRAAGRVASRARRGAPRGACSPPPDPGGAEHVREGSRREGKAHLEAAPADRRRARRCVLPGVQGDRADVRPDAARARRVGLDGRRSHRRHAGYHTARGERRHGAHHGGGRAEPRVRGLHERSPYRSAHSARDSAAGSRRSRCHRAAGSTTWSRR